MTITYTLDVSSSTFLGFHKLLFRWKGSLWKSTLPELALWLFIYSLISIIYRFALNQRQRTTFEDLCVMCYTYSDFIPLTFMLGFYVSAVFSRWWNTFNCLGWIDNVSLLLAVHVKGSNDESRMIRRNIVRYLCLLQAMTYRDVSIAVRKRFPTMDHLIAAGLLTKDEFERLSTVGERIPDRLYFLLTAWIFDILKRAREEGKIDSDHNLIEIMNKVSDFRGQVMTLTCFDWVPIPLVYTQVVNLAVRSYFCVALLGRQYLITDRNIPNAQTIDLYFPFLTALQYIFYMGWMKVAEALINPLGEDDDDFECNYILDRNWRIGYEIVDHSCDKLPVQEKDRFWQDLTLDPLYTIESAERPIHPMIGSAADMPTPPGSIMVRRRRHRGQRLNRSNSPNRDYGGSVPDQLNNCDHPLKRRISTNSSGKIPMSSRFSLVRRSSRLTDILKRKFRERFRSAQGSNTSISNTSLDMGAFKHHYHHQQQLITQPLRAASKPHHLSVSRQSVNVSRSSSLSLDLPPASALVLVSTCSCMDSGNVNNNNNNNINNNINNPSSQTDPIDSNSTVTVLPQTDNDVLASADEQQQQSPVQTSGWAPELTVVNENEELEFKKNSIAS